MSPELAKQAAQMLRDTASALRAVEKTACVRESAPVGPVINIEKLRSLLHGSR